MSKQGGGSGPSLVDQLLHDLHVRHQQETRARQRASSIYPSDYFSIYHKWRVEAALNEHIYTVDILHSCSREQCHLIPGRIKPRGSMVRGAFETYFHVCWASGRHHHCRPLVKPCPFSTTSARTSANPMENNTCVYTGALLDNEDYMSGDYYNDKAYQTMKEIGHAHTVLRIEEHQRAADERMQRGFLRRGRRPKSAKATSSSIYVWQQNTGMADAILRLATSFHTMSTATATNSAASAAASTITNDSRVTARVTVPWRNMDSCETAEYSFFGRSVDPRAIERSELSPYWLWHHDASNVSSTTTTIAATDRTLPVDDYWDVFGFQVMEASLIEAAAAAAASSDDGYHESPILQHHIDILVDLLRQHQQQQQHDGSHIATASTAPPLSPTTHYNGLAMNNRMRAERRAEATIHGLYHGNERRLTRETRDAETVKRIVEICADKLNDDLKRSPLAFKTFSDYTKQQLPILASWMLTTEARSSDATTTTTTTLMLRQLPPGIVLDDEEFVDRAQCVGRHVLAFVLAGGRWTTMAGWNAVMSSGPNAATFAHQCINKYGLVATVFMAGLEHFLFYNIVAAWKPLSNGSVRLEKKKNNKAPSPKRVAAGKGAVPVARPAVISHTHVMPFQRQLHGIIEHWVMPALLASPVDDAADAVSVAPSGIGRDLLLFEPVAR